MINEFQISFSEYDLVHVWKIVKKCLKSGPLYSKKCSMDSDPLTYTLPNIDQVHIPKVQDQLSASDSIYFIQLILYNNYYIA